MLTAAAIAFVRSHSRAYALGFASSYVVDRSGLDREELAEAYADYMEAYARTVDDLEDLGSHARTFNDDFLDHLSISYLQSLGNVVEPATARMRSNGYDYYCRTSQQAMTAAQLAEFAANERRMREAA